MNARFQAILMRFPEDNDRILEQICENADFECLCADYGECVELLASMSAELDRTSLMLKQYKELKIELEGEVLKFLSC